MSPLDEREMAIAKKNDTDDAPADLMFFNGTVMRNQPDHSNLAGARFMEEVHTAPKYKLFSIRDGYPAMVRVERGGVSISGELYLVPRAIWPRIRDSEPAGLYRGPVELEDGRIVYGMVGDADFVTRNGKDISRFGGWRTYLHQRRPSRAGHRRSADLNDPRRSNRHD